MILCKAWNFVLLSHVNNYIDFKQNNLTSPCCPARTTEILLGEYLQSRSRYFWIMRPRLDGLFFYNVQRLRSYTRWPSPHRTHKMKHDWSEKHNENEYWNGTEHAGHDCVRTKIPELIEKWSVTTHLSYENLV